MFIRFSVIVVILVSFQSMLTSAVAQVSRPRQRIAFSGFVAHGATGVPQQQAMAGEPGDLLLLRSSAVSGETIEVGAYLFYRPIDREDRPTGKWQGVPVSTWGAQHGYRSRTLHSACTAIRFSNPDQSEKEFDLSLFLPYGAVALAQGRYQFRYLIQVRSEGRLLDDFWTDDVQTGSVGPSDLLRPGYGECAAQSGPCLAAFHLVGTTDTLQPIPESVEPTRTPENSRIEEVPVARER